LRGWYLNCYLERVDNRNIERHTRQTAAKHFTLTGAWWRGLKMIQNDLDLLRRVLFPRPGFHCVIKFRRIILSKSAASRGWVCAFCVVPILAIVALALLAISPATHRGTAAAVSAGPISSLPKTVGAAARGRIQATYAALPLAFEKNQGQTDAQVEYMARGNGYTLFLTANDAVFSLHSRPAASETSKVRRGSLLRAKNAEQRTADKESSAVVRMQLVGGNSSAKVSASDELPGKSNYFLGNDPSKWRSGVPHYARVSYQDVYPGVNLAYHGVQHQTEFDFVVAPGATPAPIGFHFTGAQGVKTDDSGNLVISSAAGNVLLHKPVAYQEQNGTRQIVDARFMLKADHQVGFELGNYDRSRELVIDPAVSYEYSTYLGGSGEDEGYGIAFDSAGAAYVTGQTSSSDFPSVGGLGANPNASGFSVFVTKVSSDGATLIYSTFVGGTSEDSSANGIAVDSSNNAYVTGGTTSSDFPTHAPYQGSYTGAGDAFVFKLSSTGGALTYSTYLGGSGADLALGIAVDSAGNAYVTGSTASADFPGTEASTIQSAYGGSTDAFVTKLNSTGSTLLYSTYLGGTGLDVGGGIAVDSSGAYVVGSTESSTDFPLQAAEQSTFGGGTSDAFVAKLNPGGTALLYSTYLGGSAAEAGDGIAVDSTGAAYVTGATESSNFPTTTGVVQATYGGGTDAFVSKLSLAGSTLSLSYSTYLGGSGFDAGAGIAVDSSGIAYVTGQTASPFPTVNATQSTAGGGNDAFVSEISPTGSQLVFSTYLGGSGQEDNGGDYGAIAVSGAGDSIYVAGNTASTNFPTQSPYQEANAGGAADAFVVKYSQGPSFTVAGTTPTAVAPGTSATSTVTVTAYHGYTGSVNLTCAVTGGGSPPPACSATSFSTNPVMPTTAGATTTLTITTTGSSSAMVLPGRVFYAMWLPIAGMSVVGMGFSSSRSRRKKVLGFLIVAMVMAALFIMPACGGSSGGGGGGGCSGCTPAGSYTVTITGTDATSLTASTQITLTVSN
jgi:Beta-propeller repeat